MGNTLFYQYVTWVEVIYSFSYSRYISWYTLCFTVLKLERYQHRHHQLLKGSNIRSIPKSVSANNSRTLIHSALEFGTYT